MYTLNTDIEIEIDSILLSLPEEQSKVISNYIDNLKSEIESKDEDICELETEVNELNNQIDAVEYYCEDCNLKNKCVEIVEEQYRYIKTRYNDVKTVRDDLEHELRYLNK